MPQNFRANTPRAICVLIAMTAVGFQPTSANGQDVIGEAIGQIITPMVGPVLERAAGEIIVEGARRRYEGGRLLPRMDRRQGSRDRGRQPTYQPTQPTYLPSQPNDATPMESPAGPTPTASSEHPPVAPPAENPIVTRPSVSPNHSPMDIALSQVVSAGPEFSLQVIRAEANKITEQIDGAARAYVEQSLAGSGADGFRSDYRELMSQSRPQNARAVLLTTHKDVLDASGKRQTISALMKLADSAERVAALPGDAGHDQTVQAIERLREDLTGLGGGVIAGEALAILAERTKNLRNIAVLSEISRVLGMERREDLFARLDVAAAKTGAPSEAITNLLGVPIRSSQHAVADMQMPAGVPAVVLYNPAIHSSPIGFVCDDSLEVTLGPGELVPLDQSFVVTFQDGAGAIKKYSVESGLYRWAIDNARWDLRMKVEADLTIDASWSPVAFHYLLNGRPQSIDPGMVITHKMDGPTRIDFDLGRGDGALKSTLLIPGHYEIAVNVESGGWDLHQPQSVAPAAPTTRSIAIDHWLESVRDVSGNRSADPAGSKIDALLDLLE